jgi:C_GCAxxG_C_C family probable redox protein
MMVGEVCGAVSGAVLGIGLLYGEEQPEAVAHLAEQFVQRFREENGATRCLDIVGFNISTIDKGVDLDGIMGIIRFLARGGKRHCKKIVGSAVQVVLEQLNEWEA